MLLLKIHGRCRPGQLWNTYRSVVPLADCRTTHTTIKTNYENLNGNIRKYLKQGQTKDKLDLFILEITWIKHDSLIRVKLDNMCFRGITLQVAIMFMTARLNARSLNI